MLFNSFDFALFFPVVTLLYFLLRANARVYWLLAASLVFYSVYIPAYALILVVVILIDYFAGLLMSSTELKSRRRLYLALSLVANLGILSTFKYFDFASANLAALFHVHPVLLKWTLPIGLSFHTFQSMAYTIEVYKRRYPAERSLPHLALYVMFYPQLVAGPIERPRNLLRQLHEPHFFNTREVRSGLELMFWGLFKKAAIADRLSLISDAVFNHPDTLNGPLVLIGAVAFSFQVYCDFSGYSDMAIGAARVMGIELTPNFRRPYFASGFQDFWRRWHISLSSWFRDYVYLPLGATKAALVVVFLLSGLWHGANWTFLVWGLLHAAFRLAFPRTRSLVFPLTTYAWIFFRASSLGEAWNMTAALAQGWASMRHPLALTPAFGGTWECIYTSLAAGILLAVDWAQERGRLSWTTFSPWQRVVIYNAAILLLYALWAKDSQQFIYFKF